MQPVKAGHPAHHHLLWHLAVATQIVPVALQWAGEGAEARGHISVAPTEATAKLTASC